VKSNDPNKPNYIKFRLKGNDGKNVIPGGQLVIKDGDTFSAESIAYQKKSVRDALDAGKISEEVHDRVSERLKKVPDFVLGEIIYSFQVDDNRTERNDEEEERPKTSAKVSKNSEDDDTEDEAPKKPLKKSAKSRDAEENW